MPSINRQLRERAHTAAEQFDTTLLHNRVYDQVQGAHTTAPHLRRVLELSEECYDLADERDHRGAVHDAAFGAGELLSAQLGALTDEAIAEACAVIVRDAPEWDDDVWSDAEIAGAVDEARAWLRTHEAAADRAGVLEVVDG